MSDKFYIYTMEDGAHYRGGPPSENDLNGVDDGYMSIIDPENMTEYHGGEWHLLPEVST